MPKPWMIYGANGYRGGLIAREAVRRGLNMAGRTNHGQDAAAGREP